MNEKGSEKEFINEIASINRIFHVNIIFFLEFCNERNIRALIHNSLDKFIYENGSPTPTCNLDWNQIAIGITHFCPTIFYFGLVKICQKKESIVSILGRRGTIGYIAPEVFSRINGSVLHKSNVYSYGMLILEMVGGRKNYENRRSNSSEMYFSDWIYKDLE
ncbi:hypothetical protein Ahy_B04g071640 [Arachis hypogaea]|uniref:Protein kinase domain-containing protein n=1 Tax=Arachis hypogaea TaxID=3818 RepID=A0A444ZL83_ARAHY|nr:hypothetical protein Ahy_B04g071640 [Arachis hypogaea]